MQWSESRLVRLEWRAAARDDLLAIIKAIAEDKPLAARKLLADVEARVSALAAFPELGKTSDREGATGLRELVVHSNYIFSIGLTMSRWKSLP